MFQAQRLSTSTIVRNRHLADLSALSERKLALVTGHAGVGKTVLLKQLRQRLLAKGSKVAWVSLNAGADNPGGTVSAIVGAFRSAGYDIPNPPDRPAPPSTHDWAIALIDSVASANSGVFLCVDDYQNGDRDAHLLIDALIDYSSEQLHLVIASRDRPRRPFGKLRSQNDMIDLSDTLYFDIDETREFLRDGLGHEIEEEVIRDIHSYCGGWPMALELISRSIKERRSRSLSKGIVREYSAYLREYILEEMISNLEEEKLNIWRKLSICDRFNIELAWNLARPASYDAVASALKSDRLFLLAVDSTEPSPWYRFQPVAQELLHEQLVASSPDLIPELHTKASQWFAANNFVVEAVHHANENHAQIEGLLHNLPIELRSISGIDAILGMIARVDPSSLQSNRARILGSWALVTAGAMVKGEQWAREVFAQDFSRDPELLVHQRSLRLTITFIHDDSREFFKIYTPLMGLTNTNSFLRHATSAQAMTLLNALGRYGEVRNLARNVIRADEVNDDWALLLQGVSAVSFINEGDVYEGLRLLERIMERSVMTHGDHAMAADFCAAYMARCLYELNRIDEALNLLSGREETLRLRAAESFTWHCVVKARILREKVGVAEALRFLDTQIEYLRNVPGVRAYAQLLAESVALKLRWRGPGGGEGHRTELDRLAASLGKDGVFLDAIAHRDETEGRYHLSIGRPDSALTNLERALAHARRVRRPQEQARIGLLMASALARLQHIEASDQMLVENLELSHRLGLQRTIQDELPQLGTLLEARLPLLPLSASTKEYCDHIMNKEGCVTTTLDREKDRIDGEAFTKRELEIISLLANSMSNKRIALTLGIAPATVKWNLQNIFQKLQVSSRYDVITWSRTYLGE